MQVGWVYGRRDILKYIFLATVWFCTSIWTVLFRFKGTSFSPGIIYIPVGHILFMGFTKMQYCISVDSWVHKQTDVLKSMWRLFVALWCIDGYGVGTPGALGRGFVLYMYIRFCYWVIWMGQMCEIMSELYCVKHGDEKVWRFHEN